MAQYDVDIQLAVKNLNTIKNLKKELSAVEEALQRISKLDTFDPSGFRARSRARQDEKNQIKEQIRLTNDLKRAESARRAELLRGVRLERQQRMRGLDQYAGPIGPGPASPVGGRIRQMQEVEQLTKAAFASLSEMAVAAKAHDNAVTKSELANDDVVFKQKLAKIDALADAELAASKATNKEALDDFDRRLENRVARRKGSLFGTATARERAGAAVSAGAFPLLFGGGPGMAIGGALGGAVTGKTFGPAAIALQVLGGFFDELAAKAATLGQALNLATADIDAVVESLGMVGSPTQEAIQSLEELAGEQVALEEATRQLSLVVGDEGVQALKEFGDASTRLGNALTQITTQILAAIAQFSGPVVTQALKALEFQADLSAARQSSDPRQRLLQGQLQNINMAEDVVFGRQRADIEAEMVALQRKIKEEAEAALQAKVEAARVGSAEHVIAKNNLAIAQLDGDLTNERVFRLEKANIFQEARKKLLEKGADVKLIELERDEKLLTLANKRNDLIDAANEKAKRLSEREQKAIDRKAKAVERELERADKAFDKASRQLDDITNKHEDKMAFEREYSRLIQEGSTPAAAKQAIELKKQLLELDRQYTKLLDAVDAQILKTEASIADLKAQKGVTTEYKEQVKALEDFKKKKEELEGKRGKAKGAIEADLAPETGADKIQAEMDRVQGALNDLIDPANQVILAAQAIGDAFSESFKGLITGSMSAQEALANLFSRTADHFADMAAQMIAKQIQMKILGIALSFFNPAASTTPPTTLPGSASQTGLGLNINGVDQGISPFGSGIVAAASGGYASGPTRALVGEGGQGEYIIPESKMRESMARYSRGARGSSVIPETGASGTSGEGGGTAVAAPIDVRFNVERINNVDYVTAEQFQVGLARAAQQGAVEGERRAMGSLRNSAAVRRRIGV